MRLIVLGQGWVLSCHKLRGTVLVSDANNQGLLGEGALRTSFATFLQIKSDTILTRTG